MEQKQKAEEAHKRLPRPEPIIEERFVPGSRGRLNSYKIVKNQAEMNAYNTVLPWLRHDTAEGILNLVIVG